MLNSGDEAVDFRDPPLRPVAGLLI